MLGASGHNQCPDRWALPGAAWEGGGCPLSLPAPRKAFGFIPTVPQATGSGCYCGQGSAGGARTAIPLTVVALSPYTPPFSVTRLTGLERIFSYWINLIT